MCCTRVIKIQAKVLHSFWPLAPTWAHEGRAQTVPCPGPSTRCPRDIGVNASSWEGPAPILLRASVGAFLPKGRSRTSLRAPRKCFWLLVLGSASPVALCGLLGAWWPRGRVRHCLGQGGEGRR